MHPFGKPDVAFGAPASRCGPCNYQGMRTIRQLRKDRGVKQVAVIQASGLDKSTVYRHERGEIALFNDGARAIFAAFGLHTDDQIIAALATAEARLVGEVGAGAVVYPLDDTEERIPAPTGMDDPIAVRVTGTSMMPAYRPGDILFCETVPVTRSHIYNEDCVVETMDGQRLVKKVMQGGAPNTVRLYSYETMEAGPDVHLRSAAVVRWVQRR